MSAAATGTGNPKVMEFQPLYLHQGNVDEIVIPRHQDEGDKKVNDRLRGDPLLLFFYGLILFHCANAPKNLVKS